MQMTAQTLFADPVFVKNVPTGHCFGSPVRFWFEFADGPAGLLGTINRARRAERGL